MSPPSVLHCLAFFFHSLILIHKVHMKRTKSTILSRNTKRTLRRMPKEMTESRT